MSPLRVAGSPQTWHVCLGNLRRWGIAKRVVWPGEARATRFFVFDCHVFAAADILLGSYAVIEAA